jgi:hypothetical protein
MKRIRTCFVLKRLERELEQIIRLYEVFSGVSYSSFRVTSPSDFSRVYAQTLQDESEVVAEVCAVFGMMETESAKIIFREMWDRGNGF